MVKHYFKPSMWQTCLFIFSLNSLAPLHAAPGTISDSPLFANSNVPPNIFFEVDDSGSMDWEVLAKAYWSNCAYDRDAYRDTGNDDCGSLRTGGTFNLRPDTDGIENFEYLYDNDDDAYTNFCDDNDDDDGRRETLYSCNTSVQNSDWRIRSSSVNVVYYNPDETYTPWLGGNSTMANASFTAARSDPQSTASGYSDTIDLATFNGGFVYEVWDTADTHSFDSDDGRPRRGTNINRRANDHADFVPGFVDLWDEHTRYTVTSTNILVQRITYSPNTSDLGETATTIATLTGTDTLDGRTIAEVKQNIANWYQYYRRRSFVAKAALGRVISENPDYRYGLNFINNSGLDGTDTSPIFKEVPTGLSGYSSHNDSLLTSLYSLNWPARGTPLRAGLKRTGEYFDHNSLSKSNDPIEYECQQNFAVLFTDGFWNGDTSPAVGDEDGDGISNTVADVAKYYYKTDLSNKDNKVPDSSLDPLKIQHLVTFTVAFGVNGLLSDADNNGWPENPSTVTGAPPNLPENGDWGDPGGDISIPAKIDDLWHAAYNSKGEFVSAATPQEVADSLVNAIGSVGDRLGSASTVAFSTTSLSANSKVYLAQFNKNGNKWSGELLAYQLDLATGNIQTIADPSDATQQIPNLQWNAATVLDNRSTPVASRKIFTYDSAAVINPNKQGQGIPFRWASLTDGQKNDLKTNPDGSDGIGGSTDTSVIAASETKAQARLNFLRGDRSNEFSQSGTYSFRDRSILLGDIIHSDPVFVKTPNQGWPIDKYPFPVASGATYDDFKTEQSSRSGVIYVGANDGMLHAFDETTGEELMAYIPGNLFSSASSTAGLHFLTDPNYGHRFYVDGSATVSDVYIDKGEATPVNRDSKDGNKDWHTVLIGGNRAGGRGVFALDITDISQFSSEANAAKIVLWEFNDSHDADLGLTFSKPTIAMMNNGRWAAIFGNGYNNNGDGKAKLFILFLDGGVDGTWTPGVDYIELDTGVGSIVNGSCSDASSNCNGLSTPHAADIDGDQIVDRVYAGDILGNLWAFDVSASTNVATEWSAAYKTGSDPKPLFIASSNQPIMDKPMVVKHPDISDSNSVFSTNHPNVMVFFGTGQYLVDGDVSTVPPIQSFYGVWDHGDQEITPSDLVEQVFDTTTVFHDASGNDVSAEVRVLSNNAVDYSSNQGWKINFNIPGVSGERIIVDPDVHAGLVFFNTWIPNETPCKSGGTGFLMSVEQVNGGAPDINDPAFDFDGDGSIDNNDLVQDASDSSNKFAPVGQKFNLGLPASSSIISDNQYTPGSDGNSEVHKRKVRGDDPPGPCTSGCGLPTLPTGRISWRELR